MVTPPMMDALTPTLSLLPPPVPETITVTLTAMLTMPMVLVVQKPGWSAVPGARSLGASLRDRATLPSPLRGLDPSGGYPSRLRSLRSLRAYACPAARSAHRRVPGRRRDARFHGIVCSAASVSRFAHRSSRPSSRSPWPAAPAAGIASGSAPCAPRVAGAGFAVHTAVHRAVHWCPHRCGHSCRLDRRHLRQRASHDCPQSCLHRPPLNRRGGSPPPASPASIPPSLLPLDWTS